MPHRTFPRATLLAGFLMAAAAAALLPSQAAAEENWPEFRGPRGDGHARDARLPLTWSETENVTWKTAIHDKGWSSPVIWGDQIWMTTATPEGHEMFAICVDRASGKIVHDIKLWHVEKPAWMPDFNSYASCTPAIEAGRVYVHFGSYGTACLDTATGKILWQRRDLPCNHHRGPASSPILYGDLVILTFDGFDLQYLVGLDKHTGETIWKTDRNLKYNSDNGDIKKAFSTPTVFSINGRDLLISPSASATVAYDPRTGQEIWRVYSGGMNAAARPLFGNGLIYANSAASGFGTFAIRPDGEGDVTGTHLAWKFGRTSPKRPSQLLVDSLLFMVNDDGIAACVDAREGNLIWTHRLGGKYSASPLYNQGRIYFFDEDGETRVIEAAGEVKLLATNKLDSGCMASPAVAGDALFVRTKTHLYRIETKP